MAFRILSLDGGGTWALIQVRTLQAPFGAQARGHELVLGQGAASRDQSAAKILWLLGTS